MCVWVSEREGERITAEMPTNRYKPKPEMQYIFKAKFVHFNPVGLASFNKTITIFSKQSSS